MIGIVTFAPLPFRDRPASTACDVGNPRVDMSYLSTYYLPMTGIDTRALDRELKRGS
jgi:hypothetical protein